MRTDYDDIRRELRKGLWEELGQENGSVSRADFDRLSRELSDLLKEIGWSQSGRDKREVDEDDTGLPEAC